MTTPPTTLRWHRIRPGLYEATTSALVNGRPCPVTVWVREIPEWPPSCRWAVEVFDPTTATTFLRSDDGPEATAREAKASAIDAVSRGWVLTSIGWCGA